MVESNRDPEEDAGLPEHERDEYRERDAGLAGSDTAGEEAGLPEHEQDLPDDEDTATQTVNP